MYVGTHTIAHTHMSIYKYIYMYGIYDYICTVYEFMYIEHSLLVLWFYVLFRAKSRKMTRLVRMSVRRCTSIQAHKPFLETPNVREQADPPPHYQQWIQSW